MNTIYTWIAYRLPERLIYFATIRLMAYGTSGGYGHTNISNVRAMTVLKRWAKDKLKERIS